MNDLRERYDRVIKQIAAIHSDDDALVDQLKATKVVAEEWDDGRGGGHLKFETPPSARVVNRDTVDACAEDADGTPISIILHLVNGRVSWGEWFRVDAEPIICWPPTSVRRLL